MVPTYMRQVPVCLPQARSKFVLTSDQAEVSNACIQGYGAHCTDGSIHGWLWVCTTLGCGDGAFSVTDSLAVYPVLPMWWCVVAGSNMNPVIADIETTDDCMPADHL